jgi:hypothetical protein
MKEKKIFSPLEEWLRGTTDLTSFVELNDTQANFEIGGFLMFENIIPIYDVVDLEAESLDISWKRTNNYLEKSFDILVEEYPQKTSLDREEASMIIEELGNPPKITYPIYMITVKKDDDEKIVYIGQTSSSKNRFKSGHAAITKLHRSDYDGFEKKLYQCAVMFLNNHSELVPLEWIKPLEKAKMLLNSIEAQLIFHFQPELNTNLKKNDKTTIYVQLHCQNHHNYFMHDEFV